MTKEEFINYINSFGKQVGEYTDDELYQIGLAHKTIPIGDRSWSWLTVITGIKRTSEGYRKWVSAKFNQEDIDTGKLAQDLYIEKQKIRDEKNEFRATLRDEARLEEIKELLAKSIKELKPLPVIKPTPVGDKNNEAVLLLSDLHIGVVVDEFYNKYNVDVARERLGTLLDETIRLCKNNRVKTLNVCNLGDMIQGIIHISARLQQEKDVIDQITIASELLATFLNDLKKTGARIIYRSVIDNHSRATANLKEHIEKENFNRLIDWYIEARLNNSGIIFAHDNLDLEIGKILLQNNKTLIFTHGHHDNFKTALQSYLGATKEYIDYICFGHYHSSKLETYQNAKVIINGSIVGTEQYAYSKRLFSDPEQTLLLFSGNTLSVNYISLNSPDTAKN